MSRNKEIKKAKKQFWTAFAFFVGIVALLILGYFVLSTLNFFG